MSAWPNSQPLGIAATPHTSEDYEKKLPPCPHVLLSMPRSLRDADVWRNLGGGARDLYQFLLSFSNTRSFCDAFPGSKLIEDRLGIDKRTRRRYENLCVRARILKIHPPGRTVKLPDGYKTYKGRSFEFTIKSYINADYREFNKAHGGTIYKLISSSEIVLENVRELADRLSFDLSRVISQSDAMTIALNEYSKRLQYDSSDEHGKVFVRLHSTVFRPDFAGELMPENVVVIQEKKNKDLVFNTRETWDGFLSKIEKKLNSAEMHRKQAPLLDFIKSIKNKDK